MCYQNSVLPKLLSALNAGQEGPLTGGVVKAEHEIGDAGEEERLRQVVGHLYEALRRRKGQLAVHASRPLPVHHLHTSIGRFSVSQEPTPSIIIIIIIILIIIITRLSKPYRAQVPSIYKAPLPFIRHLQLITLP